ncbi:hypothetical protein BpHYR1_018173 [Brachionus plicatilis]|uniref:Uncharacterized protein n=1 Tax=Brachionus plicatilis TaxID=10195 RepID=A0A3M7SHJ8_BRAPC|nr:hypothetical protein BpHYR1_018173 [Brachionus plicatilis]
MVPDIQISMTYCVNFDTRFVIKKLNGKKSILPMSSQKFLLLFKIFFITLGQVTHSSQLKIDLKPKYLNQDTPKSYFLSEINFCDYQLKFDSLLNILVPGNTLT